jgi:hypothetical protein
MTTTFDFNGNHQDENPPFRRLELTTVCHIYPVITDAGNYEIHYNWTYGSHNASTQIFLEKEKIETSEEEYFCIDTRDSDHHSLESIRSNFYKQIDDLKVNGFIIKPITPFYGKVVATINYKNLILISGSPEDKIESTFSSPITTRYDNARIRKIPVNSPNVYSASLDPVLDAFNAILKHAGLAERRAVFPYVTLDNPLRQR